MNEPQAREHRKKELTDLSLSQLMQLRRRNGRHIDGGDQTFGTGLCHVYAGVVGVVASGAGSTTGGGVGSWICEPGSDEVRTTIRLGSRMSMRT